MEKLRRTKQLVRLLIASNKRFTIRNMDGNLLVFMLSGVQVMKPDCNIQVFSPEYENQIIDLICHIQQVEFDIAINPDQQPDLRNITSFYQQGRGNFWVALHNDTVVGTVALLDIGNNQAALRKMFVHKEYRGKEAGIAKALLDTLLIFSKKQDLKEIYLGTTTAFTAAHRFYEKNGFIEIQWEKLPQHFPIMSVDSIFYIRTL